MQWRCLIPRRSSGTRPRLCQLDTVAFHVSLLMTHVISLEEPRQMVMYPHKQYVHQYPTWSRKPSHLTIQRPAVPNKPPPRHPHGKFLWYLLIHSRGWSRGGDTFHWFSGQDYVTVIYHIDWTILSDNNVHAGTSLVSFPDSLVHMKPSETTALWHCFETILLWSCYLTIFRCRWCFTLCQKYNTPEQQSCMPGGHGWRWKSLYALTISDLLNEIWVYKLH